MTTPSKNPLSFDVTVFARRIFRLQVSMGQTASKAPTAKSPVERRPSTDLSGSFRTNKKSKEEGSFGKAERRPSADIRNQNLLARMNDKKHERRSPSGGESPAMKRDLAKIERFIRTEEDRWMELSAHGSVIEPEEHTGQAARGAARGSLVASKRDSMVDGSRRIQSPPQNRAQAPAQAGCLSGRVSDFRDTPSPTPGPNRRSSTATLDTSASYLSKSLDASAKSLDASSRSLDGSFRSARSPAGIRRA